MAKKKKNLADMVKAPRKIDINGQLHMLAWITADEGKTLKALGGAGTPGPMGIPTYYSSAEGADEDEASEQSEYSDDQVNYDRVTDSLEKNKDNLSYFGLNKEIEKARDEGRFNDIEYDKQGNITGAYSMTDIPGLGALSGLLGGPTQGRTYSGYGKEWEDTLNTNDDNDTEEIKKAVQAVAEKIPDESPLTDAMKAYYGKGIGTSTIDMSTAAGRATSLANMTSPSTSAIGGKFDPATGRYIFPDGRIFDTATGKFLPISQSNKIEGLDLFRPLEGVK